jgi:hypothetical protein
VSTLTEMKQQAAEREEDSNLLGSAAPIRWYSIFFNCIYRLLVSADDREHDCVKATRVCVFVCVSAFCVTVCLYVCVCVCVCLLSVWQCFSLFTVWLCVCRGVDKVFQTLARLASSLEFSLPIADNSKSGEEESVTQQAWIVLTFGEWLSSPLLCVCVCVPVFYVNVSVRVSFAKSYSLWAFCEGLIKVLSHKKTYSTTLCWFLCMYVCFDSCVLFSLHRIPASFCFQYICFFFFLFFFFGPSNSCTQLLYHFSVMYGSYIGDTISLYRSNNGVCVHTVGWID